MNKPRYNRVVSRLTRLWEFGVTETPSREENGSFTVILVPW